MTCSLRIEADHQNNQEENKDMMTKEPVYSNWTASKRNDITVATIMGSETPRAK